MGAADLRSEWDEKWLQYCRERVLACGLPRSMPTPSPETLADALSKPWMAEAIAEAERRAHFLMLASASAERVRDQTRHDADDYRTCHTTQWQNDGHTELSGGQAGCPVRGGGYRGATTRHLFQLPRAPPKSTIGAT